ncbi:hypothetical protein ARMA_2493 [Ardenticatena maritima]|uniref:Uncharacterized protein n=1 Tax=Ardenticatena maritima TaxID=872965 RepID=A0A0M9UDK3_9CHLR|nr:hypothetical protein ARMA_2493 [Ardenticatena maritima]
MKKILESEGAKLNTIQSCVSFRYHAEKPDICDINKMTSVLHFVQNAI